MVRAVLRLVLMVLVMAAVLLTTTAVGLPATAVLGLSITVAGLVGMVGLSRRGAIARDAAREATPARATARARAAGAANAVATELPADLEMDTDPVVASMAPDSTVDPEAHMPRWRRPSLLAARHADPARLERLDRAPLRFGLRTEASPSRRVVRYAVVALLDRPDEVLGRRLSDLTSGDEVEVMDTGGAFWEVLCPDGLRGWVHRTTLGMPGAEQLTFGRRVEAVPEPDDILTAVLTARGIQ